MKIFERIVVKKIVEHLDSQSLFNDGQHGFRKERSCLSQLLDHYHHILNILEDQNVAEVIYLDFAKAFDKVDHGILLMKLRTQGIGMPLLKWIKSFLSGRKQKVVVEGHLSEPCVVQSGVPQGTVLGPLLFLIHIGDIDSGLRYSTASSFADDTRIVMPLKTMEDASKLQEDLTSIYEWADENNMAFNGGKFEHLRYGGLHEDHVYTAPEGLEIPTKTEVKDLGVMMSSSGKHDQQIQDIVKSGNMTAGWILRVFKSRDQKVMLTLYKSIVLPKMEYCSVLWSPKSIGLVRLLEGVQRSFTHRISGMRDLSYWQRLSALRLYSLERRRDRYSIIYVWKVLNGLAPNLTDGRCSIQQMHNIRRGKLCIIPPFNRYTPRYLQTLKENSFAIHGPRLFNALPREIRDLEGDIDCFKFELDKFLRGIPDKPALPHYAQSAAGNGLLEQLAQQRAEAL